MFTYGDKLARVITCASPRLGGSCIALGRRYGLGDYVAYAGARRASGADL